MEAFGELELHPQLFANLVLSYQVGKQIAEPGAPETPFNGASPLTVLAGLRYVDPVLGIQGELIGTFANGVESTTPSNTFQPEGYAVFDTIWSWKPIETWTLRAAVYNIADSRYFKWPMPYNYTVPPGTGVAVSNPLELQTQPGRTYKVGLSVEF